MDKETKPFEPLVDSHQAAALLGIHPKTLQKMARAGTVPCHRIGDLWRFRASELDRWLHTGVKLKTATRAVTGETPCLRARDIKTEVSE
jgi:excisionase family DNA binding protein